MNKSKLQKPKGVARKSTYRGKHRFVNPGLMGSPSAGPMLVEGMRSTPIAMTLPRSVLPVSGGAAADPAKISKIDEYTKALAKANAQPGGLTDSGAIGADPCLFDPALKNSPACGNQSN